MIYADTIDNSIHDYGDYFLLGFKSLYTNNYSYVVPRIIKRNYRFIQFEIDVFEENDPEQDPLNGYIDVFPPGNYSYKCWNTEIPILDPSAGFLIDQGQMIMAAYKPPEVQQVSYVSDNETFLNIIYYSGEITSNCFINYVNSPFIIPTTTTNKCQPLIISEDGGYLEIEDGVVFTLN